MWATSKARITPSASSRSRKSPGSRIVMPCADPQPIDTPVQGTGQKVPQFQNRHGRDRAPQPLTAAPGQKVPRFQDHGPDRSGSQTLEPCPPSVTITPQDFIGTHHPGEVSPGSSIGVLPWRSQTLLPWTRSGSTNLLPRACPAYVIAHFLLRRKRRVVAWAHRDTETTRQRDTERLGPRARSAPQPCAQRKAPPPPPRRGGSRLSFLGQRPPTAGPPQIPLKYPGPGEMSPGSWIHLEVRRHKSVEHGLSLSRS